MLLQPDDNNSYSFKMEFDEGGLVSNWGIWVFNVTKERLKKKWEKVQKSMVYSIVVLISRQHDLNSNLDSQRRIPRNLFPPGVTDHLFRLSWIFWKMLLPPLHFSLLKFFIFFTCSVTRKKDMDKIKERDSVTGGLEISNTKGKLWWQDITGELKDTTYRYQM